MNNAEASATRVFRDFIPFLLLACWYRTEFLCEPARLSSGTAWPRAIVRAAPVGDLQRDWQFADASDWNENATVHGSLSLADFSFDLPPELIAQTPADERSASRLLHVDSAALADLQFRDLPQ